MRCLNCNSEVAEGMQFCPYCGSQMASQQQPRQNHYLQSYQGQYQQPYQGQYQQPYEGQYQQSYHGQYQQSYQGRYQNYQQGQYQQPYSGQYQHYQQGYYQHVHQKQQLPHRPQLTFMEAITLASSRLTEFEGRSRRSEFWWWVLVVTIGCTIMCFIPFIGNLFYLVDAFLMYAVFTRRLNDCRAPNWLRNTVLASVGVSGFLQFVWGFAMEDIDLAVDFISLMGRNFYFMQLAFSLWYLVGLIYAIKDSDPEVDPMHGPSPKYII